MRDPSGIPFGHYRLIRRLARGGMAEVFLARQRGPEGFDRMVALTRILPHLVDNADFVRMFLDEARLAARLSHPNIVHIYEFGKVDEHFFIAMEFVHGVHAGHLIKRGAAEPLSPALVARLGADACAGLHYAHRLEDADGRPQLLVHRDVSPPNLMLSYDGVVKLVDFGIAKAVSQVEQTRPGVVKGKFAYMSPEQTTGRPLDGRSDVFSLGLVLWELLAGRVAVDRTDPVEGMRSIRDGKLPAIEEVRPDVPRALAYAVGRALTVDPSERVSAAELGVTLEEFIKASPALGTSMELAEWVRERFPRESVTGSQPALGPSPGATRPATIAATQRATGVTPGGTVPATTPATTVTPHGSAPATFGATDRQGSEPEPETELYDPPTALVVTPPGYDWQVEAVDASGKAPGRRWGRVALVALATIAAAAAIVIAVGGGPRTASSGDVTGALGEDAAAATAGPDLAESAAGAEADAAGPVAFAMEAADASPPRADAAPAFARLEVLTTPSGAQVSVGRVVLTAPARFEDLEPGSYLLAVTLPGHEPLERDLELSPGERRTLELSLTAVAARPTDTRRPPRPVRPQRGQLTVRTTPYSEVYLGARKLGITPFANIELPAGTHELLFRNPDRSPHRRRVTIRAGETTKLNFPLP